VDHQCGGCRNLANRLPAAHDKTHLLRSKLICRGQNGVAKPTADNLSVVKIGLKRLLAFLAFD
jgi:hypothetical protein